MCSFGRSTPSIREGRKRLISRALCLFQSLVLATDSSVCFTPAQPVFPAAPLVGSASDEHFMLLEQLFACAQQNPATSLPMRRLGVRWRYIGALRSAQREYWQQRSAAREGKAWLRRG